MSDFLIRLAIGLWLCLVHGFAFVFLLAAYLLKRKKLKIVSANELQEKENE